MNWINSIRPKIRGLLTTKRDLPDNLWVKCPDTGQMVFYKDLEANQFVVPGSDYHMRMEAQKRLAHLFDNGEYEKVPVREVPQDPLKFRDGKRYSDRLKAMKAETELDDAVLVGEGKLEGQHVVAAAQDFRFMAGSLGMAAGEAVVTGMMRAVERRSPFILFAASGGARMQEGILSLMQMPRTTIAVQMLREARLPYLVVLTDPTTGGVSASYAMLGDIHIAEPGALICFAGPRVIQQTIREQLPEGFQKAEYLLAHGMIDMVVHRHQMRETLARLCRLLTGNAAGARATRALAPAAEEHGYLNGSVVDGTTIETLARSYDDVLEPGKEEDGDRDGARS
ncbi:MAG TPA: acetyl-CoA carboxylase, carboxyltransferase subunit beta [Hyphomicrobiaceae bacterium]|nr:acetyl-CoA carboxylase, carboxyltransferase subunit beta [Hyphomicrobiaceae bacterium]